MLENFLRTLNRLFWRLVLLLLPAGVFYGGVVSDHFSLVEMVCIGIVCGFTEVFLVKKFLLAWIGNAFASTVYASNISDGSERVVEESEKLRAAGDTEGAWELVRNFRLQDDSSLRAWLMESALLNELHRYERAAEVLEEGRKAHRWNDENQALFLYKLAVAYDHISGTDGKARQAREEAARLYPATAYGQAAARMLNEQ